MEVTGKMTLRLINQVDSPTDSRGVFDMPLPGIPLPWYLGGTHRRIVGCVSGKTISGRTVTDEEITLDDCHLLTSGWMQQPRQISLIVNEAYIGLSLSADEELQCESVSWIAEGVEGWLNPSGPSASARDYFSVPSTAVSTTAAIEGLGDTTVTFGLLGGFSRGKGNVHEIRESGYAMLKPPGSASWKTTKDYVYEVHRFLRFALNRLCVIRQLTVEANGERVEVVEQGMRNSGERAYRPGQVRFDALFTADQKEAGVVGNPAEVLRKWLEIPSAAQGTLIRLHGLMVSTQFLDTQVVSACGAGELWYSQIIGNTHEWQDERLDLLSDEARAEIESLFMKNGWHGLYRRRIKRILDTPNELSTGLKVKRMFDPIEREVLPLNGDEECEVSRGLLALRHPWSHGDVVLKRTLGDMSMLVRKARAILKLRVLEYLGVDWRSAAKYNKTIRWELGLDESWHALPYPVYQDMSAAEAAVDYMRRAGRRTTLVEITDAMLGGGWKTVSKKPTLVVSYYLTRHMREGGPVIRTKDRGKVLWEARQASELGGPVVEQ